MDRQNREKILIHVINILNLSIKKQLGYANKNKIPFVVFVGDDELKSKKYSVKEMNTGDQELLTISELINKLA